MLIGIGMMLGIVFVSTWPFINAWLSPPSQSAAISYDEANRQMKIYFLYGGMLFGAMGGWIGNVAYASGLRALAMAGAVLCATVLLKIIASWLDVPIGSIHYQMLLAILTAWASLAAVSAGLVKLFFIKYLKR